MSKIKKLFEAYNTFSSYADKGTKFFLIDIICNEIEKLSEKEITLELLLSAEEHNVDFKIVETIIYKADDDFFLGEDDKCRSILEIINFSFLERDWCDCCDCHYSYVIEHIKSKM